MAGSALSLTDGGFWFKAGMLQNTLLGDGAFKYVLMSGDAQMRVVWRKDTERFSDLLRRESQTATVVVNGPMYDLNASLKAGIGLGRVARALSLPAGTPLGPIPQAQVQPEGMVIERGVALPGGKPEPNLFWFGRMIGPKGVHYLAGGPGDPPLVGSTNCAVGGVGPMIVGALPYGANNAYRGLPAAAAPFDYGNFTHLRAAGADWKDELYVDQDGHRAPLLGAPDPLYAPMLVQRSNATLASHDQGAPEKGKTVLAYHGARRILMVAVQPNGAAGGRKLVDIAHDLAGLGFDNAVFLDGSTSASMAVDGIIEARPTAGKDETIPFGLAFAPTGILWDQNDFHHPKHHRGHRMA